MKTPCCSRRRPGVMRFSPIWLLTVAIAMGTTFGPVPALGQRPVGIDISHYDDLTNWAEIRASGVTFAWTKATQGTNYSDPTLATNVANARSVGILIGAYHFATPTNNPGNTGAAAEAAHFWEVASNYIQGGSSYLMPMLDVEQSLTGPTRPTPKRRFRPGSTPGARTWSTMPLRKG